MDKFKGHDMIIIERIGKQGWVFDLSEYKCYRVTYTNDVSDKLESYSLVFICTAFDDGIKITFTNDTTRVPTKIINRISKVIASTEKRKNKLSDENSRE